MSLGARLLWAEPCGLLLLGAFAACLPLPRADDANEPFPCSSQNDCITGYRCIDGLCGAPGRGDPGAGDAETDADPCATECAGRECGRGPVCGSLCGTCSSGSCDASGHCVACAPTQPCDDGDLCTWGDTCDVENACRGTPITCANDPEPCGTVRTCNGSAACDVWQPDSGVSCDDGNLCTWGDHCDGSGACTGTPITCISDSEPCGVQRACDGSPECAARLPGLETGCDDFDLCTYDDRCQGDGTCEGTGIACVSDGCTVRSCSGQDSCIESANPDRRCDPPSWGYQCCKRGDTGCQGSNYYWCDPQDCLWRYQGCFCGSSCDAACDPPWDCVCESPDGTAVRCN